jgi:predicted RNA polymerase sigma factor
MVVRALEVTRDGDLKVELVGYRGELLLAGGSVAQARAAFTEAAALAADDAQRVPPPIARRSPTSVTAPGA